MLKNPSENLLHPGDDFQHLTSLLYFVVRVRCRRKESSRSLSHLLMSSLLNEYRYFTSDVMVLMSVTAESAVIE